jgi:hypothetical protein
MSNKTTTCGSNAAKFHRTCKARYVFDADGTKVAYRSMRQAIEAVLEFYFNAGLYDEDMNLQRDVEISLHNHAK